jgi:hypothetical protein
VTDYFTPYAQLKLAKYDLDLGSGSGMLLPTQKGKFPDEIITAGKEGLIYVVDRSNMGKFDAQKNRVIETVCRSATGYWGSAAYWNNTVYYSGTEDFLSQYASSNGLLSKSPVYQAPTKFVRGSTPCVSANGSANAVLWTIEKIPYNHGIPPEVLHAYNATKVSQEVYNTNQAGTRDLLGPGITFLSPPS